ncbi:unnamed protein product [Ascophyllum nodosum]
MDNAVEIPTVDIGPLLATRDTSYTEQDRRATASSLQQASQKHGVLFLKGHGITAEHRQLAFENSRCFFSLSDDTKRKIPVKKGGFTRGYVPFGGESGSQRLECKEAFSFGYPWQEDKPPTNALQGPNIWPDSNDLAPEWREDWISFFRLMVSVHEAVTRGLAMSADLGLEELPSLCCGGETISVSRLMHYFPYSNDPDGGDGDPNTLGSSAVEKIGSSPHTDWGLSTTIMQDGAGGLQFLDQATQRWIDVPCDDEDALVFLCGDYMSLLSKGRTKSPVHQVVTTGVERTSFSLFYYPSFDAALPVEADTSGHVPTESDVKGRCSDHTEAEDVGYNTLLDLKRGDSRARVESFGQYLTRKWCGVFRD